MSAKGLGKLKIIGIIVGVIIVLCIIFFSLLDYIVDYLWFSELGYTDVFFKKIVTQLKIGVPAFVILIIIGFLIQALLKRKFSKKIADQKNIIISKKLRNFGLIACNIVMSLFLTIMLINNLWYKILEFTKATDFDLTDPIFKNDISFYMFRLDLLKEIPSLLILLTIAFAVFIFISYCIIQTTTHGLVQTDEPVDREPSRFEELFYNITGRQFNINNNSNTTIRKKSSIDFRDLFSMLKTEAIILIIVFCLSVAFAFFLQQYSILYGDSDVVKGAGYTDVHITLWMYRILIGVAVLSAIIIPVAIKRKSIKTFLVAPILFVLVFAVGGITGGIVQNIVVAPDAIQKETPYLKNNIRYTKYAYDLDKVDVQPFKADNTLTSQDIKDNDTIFKNIRINDYQQAMKFYNQVQNIRRYYHFNDVDVDRYFINGEYTQTFLSAREIEEGQVDNQWINKHIKYTHGYGATVSRVDKVTANGQPDVIVKDIPPISADNILKISVPGIYFGELTDNYILVDTDEEEFDYPDGSKNVYTRYDGNAGIKLNLFNKILFAIKQQSLKLLVSSNIKDDSKIIINRNVMDRVNKLMPNLSYSDPYAVVIKGKIYWIIDGYTKSNKYPYSEKYDGVNYIRNSVKVVIDAYNGDTSYYLVDDKDPMANTIKKIYPTLFKDASKMPKSIRAHIRYPHTMLRIQSQVYTKYHVDDVKVFYQQEDTWAVSGEIFGTDEVVMDPSYFILKLPGEKKEEFVSILPYTPKDKKNMTGMIVARNDNENYGKLVLYQFPKSRTIMGPIQVEAQIDQDTAISKEFSLWKNAGSTYSRGNMFVIPVGDSLVYVEPIYLEAKNSSLPEVKRVVVYYKNKIAYQPTLAEALDEMFGEGSANLDTNDQKNDPPASKTKTRAELIKEAATLYDEMNDALKRGDFKTYGEKLKKLGEVLKQLDEGN